MSRVLMAMSLLLATTACSGSEEKTDTEEEIDYDALCPIGEPDRETDDEEDFVADFLTAWNDAREAGGSCGGEDYDAMDALVEDEAFSAYARCLAQDVSDNDFDAYSDGEFSDGTSFDDAEDAYDIGSVSTNAISGASDPDDLLEYLMEESDDGCEDLFDDGEDTVGIAAMEFRGAFTVVFVHD